MDLASIASWTLVAPQPNTSTGFGGAAFQDPITHAIIFAFRGTEVNQGILAAVTDFASDAQAAMNGTLG
jgi:hypothetical protein